MYASLAPASAPTASVKARPVHENEIASPGTANGSGNTSDNRHRLLWQSAPWARSAKPALDTGDRLSRAEITFRPLAQRPSLMLL
jgi:hypothetical protein